MPGCGPKLLGCDILDGPGAREQTAVDRIHHWRGVDHASAKVSAVKSLDRVLAALDFVELEIDVTLGVGVDRDVHNVAVLLLGFPSDVVFEFLDPVVSFLPIVALAT